MALKTYCEKKFPSALVTLYTPPAQRQQPPLVLCALPQLFYAYIQRHSPPPLNRRKALSKMYCSASYFFFLLLDLGNNFMSVHRKLPCSYIWLHGILLSV